MTTTIMVTVDLSSFRLLSVGVICACCLLVCVGVNWHTASYLFNATSTNHNAQSFTNHQRRDSLLFIDAQQVSYVWQVVSPHEVLQCWVHLPDNETRAHSQQPATCQQQQQLSGSSQSKQQVSSVKKTNEKLFQVRMMLTELELMNCLETVKQ